MRAPEVLDLAKAKDQQFGSGQLQKEALDEQKVGKRSERVVEQGDARGVQRAEMKATLFYVLDEDGAGT
ncbi:hypothetical protein AK812_SmicGene22767 [Symbiodinium microadriaticum]|uniref:Uncharacterized protein n=1 Tax=Symbiodinium microadriaticum TaxID=2951 RepID=A0A1Q9DIZ9_SYMMI|nr:hypothetical protein AK812_SmicGene22767 [Symbiodinium microadriaticum]